MSINNNNSSIIIENLIPGEKVFNSLTLIEGHLSPNVIEPKLNRIKVQLKTSFTNSVHYFEIVLDRFKCMLDLNLGVNYLTFSYNKEVLNFHLNFVQDVRTKKVLPVYIICQNDSGLFQAPEGVDNSPSSACNRIMVGCKLLQCVFATKFQQIGLKRKTFQLASDECAVHYSGLDVERVGEMTSKELWRFFGFLSCTLYNGEGYTGDAKSYEDLVGLTRGYVAIGGGGLALLGTGCLYTWPEQWENVVAKFNDNTPVDKAKFMDDSCYRETHGACFSTTLGATLHELCHCFDLGHTQSGIMSRGFDNLQDFFLLPYKRDCDYGIKQKLNISESVTVSNMPLEQKHYVTDLITSCYDGDVSWTRSGTAIFYHHKWFNNYDSTKTFILSYDGKAKVVRSTVGIRVIELRSGLEELMLFYWVFSGKVLRYYFVFSEDIIGNIPAKETLVLFVEDNLGNVLKETIIV